MLQTTEQVITTTSASNTVAVCISHAECSPHSEPDYLDNKDCADAEASAASYAHKTAMNPKAAGIVVAQYCVEMEDKVDDCWQPNPTFHLYCCFFVCPLLFYRLCFVRLCSLPRLQLCLLALLVVLLRSSFVQQLSTPPPLPPLS